jgi:hypothetical protein
MPEVWAIAYDFEPYVDRKLAETPEDEGIRLAIEREKSEFKPRYTNREEFDRFIKLLGQNDPRLIEEAKREEIRKGLRRKLLDEMVEKIGLNEEWSIKKIVNRTISFLKENKIPYLLNVFKNTIDDDKVWHIVSDNNDRIKKLKNPYYYTWVIPDYEEDPPIDGMLSEESVILLAGLLTSGASILLSYLIKKGMTV